MSTAGVTLMRGSEPDDDAVVTVNGTPLFRQWGNYYWAGVSGLRPGQGVVLDVLSGGLHVTGTSTFPGFPSVTSPVSGTTLDPSADVSVAWVPGGPGGERVVVSASWDPGDGSMSVVSMPIDGAASSVTIPAASLPTGRDIRLVVSAINDGLLAGDYTGGEGGSEMMLQADSVVTFIRQAP